MTSPEVHARHFQRTGWTVIEDALSKDIAQEIQWVALDAIKDSGIHKQGTSSGGGRSRYWVLDGATVQRLYPELFDWYELQVPLLSKITNREVVLSEYPRSSINLKIYRADGGSQGWHYDTNPLSAVLFLTDGGSPLSIRDITGEARLILPSPGKLVLMNGREVFHEVPPCDGDRVTAVLNYYYSDDRYRPEWIDRAIYENEDPPRLT